MNKYILCILFTFTFFSDVYAETIPKTTSYFTSSLYTLTTGSSITLSWGKPSGYSDEVRYNVYVIKPGDSKYRFITNTTATSTVRRIGKSGNHKFYVEACNLAGQCGSQRSFSINVYDIPSTTPYFTSSLYTLTTGSSITLSWGKPSGYSGEVRYNVYVIKPGDSKYRFITNTTATSTVRRIGKSGNHKFYVEACNLAGQCGSQRSFSINVYDIPSTTPYFISSSYNLATGNSATLSWDKPSGYSDEVRYNLYVIKPGDSKYRFITNTTATSTVRRINKTGKHDFYIEACNLAGRCGPQRSFSINVEDVPGSVAMFTSSLNSISSGTYVTLSWSKPTGYSQTAYYNLSVKKPDHTFTNIMNGTTELSKLCRLDMVGSHEFLVEACNAQGSCGPQQSLSVSVTGTGKVSTFSTSATSINTGSATTLTWTPPFGFNGVTYYNLYVEKPDGSPKYKFQQMITDIEFVRTLNMAGTHKFYVEACNEQGECGPQQSLSVSVTGTGKVSTFSTSATSINTGSATTLTWTPPFGFNGVTYYNLYVEKPDGSPKYKFQQMITDIEFVRTLNMAGTHKFYVEACNEQGECGPQQSLSVSVTGTGKVSTFSTSATSINTGSATTLTWTPPFGFNGVTYYNLYVEKPDGSPKYKFQQMITDIEFVRTLNMAGTHKFYVEACNEQGECGPQQSLSVSVTGTGKVSTFSTSATSINTGSATTLTWTPPFGFNGVTYYNLYVEKPDGSPKYKFQQMITDTEFVRTLNMAGTHKFYVEACNEQGECGPQQSLSVNAIGIGKVSAFLASDLSISKGETTTLTWLAPFGYSGIAYYNLYVEKPDGSPKYKFQQMITDTEFVRTLNMAGTHKFYVEACNEQGECGPQQSLSVDVDKSKIIFIHTDLLGTPVIETNNRSVL